VIRPDPLGLIDLASGVLLYFTASPLPEFVAVAHSGFLVFKGLGTIVQPVPLPMPVFFLGGAADLLSAAIMVTGQPPLIGETVKDGASLVLFLKGVWTGLGAMA
jgi:hypothetical protein